MSNPEKPRTKDEVFREMQQCLVHLINLVKYPRKNSQEELKGLAHQANLLVDQADEVDYVRIPYRVYEALSNFIFNSCRARKEEYSGFLAQWERDLIDDLADFLSEKGKEA